MADDQVTTTPWRDRRAFLVGVTAAAGWLDALAFLHLGKVFNSFMTGNVLFVGFGIGEGDGGLVVRAGAALAAFVLGSFVGARIVGSRLTVEAERVPLTRALSLEAGLLTAFAVLWIATGASAGQPVVQVVLLALGAAAMGVQAALSLALKIPNVATVALTATIAQLAALVGWRRREGVIAPEIPPPALMGPMILTYFAGALIVALAQDWRILSLGPLALLAFGVGTRRSSRASHRRRLSPQT
jgi:uncharacterized membrane protein YoaK (UPF0700 family)